MSMSCLVDEVSRFLCEYVTEEPSTLLEDVDALYQWAKLSGDSFCIEICMHYALVTGFAAHAVTAIIRN